MNEPPIVIEMYVTAYLVVERGSIVYGTVTPKSDRDIVAVVPDTYSEFLSQYENGIYEYTDEDSGDDTQFVAESTWLKMIDDHNIMAIEALFCPLHVMTNKNGAFEKYRDRFHLDKWIIRQVFSGTASNSWAKAHKKMTVEKDLDVYRGQKSLFHSLRILMFANQLCEHGKIVDYHEGNDIWKEIYAKELSWDEYKAKYKPLYNELRSKLAKLAPKP